MRSLGLTVGFLVIAPALSVVPAAAESADDGSAAAAQLSPQLAAGHVARYRVTFAKSSTVLSPRSATVISVTNNGSITCGTSVDWFFGNNSGTPACTTSITLAPGSTLEHCPRGVPSGLAVCNATCSPAINIEGNAVVGSTSGAACGKIAVEARTFYTTGSSDETLNGVAESNLVKITAGNSGD